MIQPVVALVAWSLVMLVWLYAVRLPTLFRYALTEQDPRGDHAARTLPAFAQWPADNYNNLLEQPTLFYALCLGIYLGNLSTPALEYFAWLYVALRILHSLVQAINNITVIRFCLFVASSGVLGLMCFMAVKQVFGIG